MIIVEAIGLHKAYEKNSRDASVLRGVDLSLERGDCVALLGASGSGKSTLLNCLGLLDLPDSGEIRLLGKSTKTFSDNQRAAARLQNIGFVFQFHHLIPELNAEENVMLPASLLGKAKKARATELLDRVGLKDKRHRHPWQLSGGEQQRVALARALMNEAPLLLTDEVTGNLDRTRAEETLDLLLGVVRDTNTALLSVTHDEEMAARYKKQYRLKDGQIWDLTGKL
jgi:ABC-type lipoprotein export system ATPase subunit